MLETEYTYAEQLVKLIKKKKKKEQIDYIHPDNRIENGYIIVNYHKRNLERKELMDGKIHMILPEDWEEKKEKNSTIYAYGSVLEKENLVLSLTEIKETRDMKYWLEEVNMREKGKFQVTEEGEIVTKQGIKITYQYVTDQAELFLALIEGQIEEKVLQGTFAMHY